MPKYEVPFKSTVEGVVVVCVRSGEPWEEEQDIDTEVTKCLMQASERFERTTKLKKAFWQEGYGKPKRVT